MPAIEVSSVRAEHNRETQKTREVTVSSEAIAEPYLPRSCPFERDFNWAEDKLLFIRSKTPFRYSYLLWGCLGQPLIFKCMPE